MTIPPTVCDCGHVLLHPGMLAVEFDGMSHTETECTPVGAA